MPNLTFVTSEPKTDFDMWIKKSHPDISIKDRIVLDNAAARWVIDTPLEKSALDDIRREFRVDVFQTDEGTNIKLFIADMDATIVKGETLDDMAELAGIGDKIAAITTRAMRGELDFKQALRERVSMLAGHPAALIDMALEQLEFNGGARELIAHLKSKGVYCVLVSGGFTQFTSYVANELGFDAHFGNELIIGPRTNTVDIPFLGQATDLITSPDNLILTGEVGEPILDKDFKLQKLRELQASMKLQDDQIMAIGDGANDLPMLQAAGIGIAYHGKPLLRESLVNQVQYTDLSALRWVI